MRVETIACYERWRTIMWKWKKRVCASSGMHRHRREHRVVVLRGDVPQQTPHRKWDLLLSGRRLSPRKQWHSGTTTIPTTELVNISWSGSYIFEHYVFSHCVATKPNFICRFTLALFLPREIQQIFIVVNAFPRMVCQHINASRCTCGAHRHNKLEGQRDDASLH
jgi:hypothetical protein